MEMSRDEDARQATAPIRGRGAASRVAGRFERRELRGEDDGWGSVYADLEGVPKPATTVAEERARSAYACENRTIVTRRARGNGKDWNDALQAWLRSKS